MLNMSRRAQLWWGLFWAVVGWLWCDVIGAGVLDARGGPGSALQQTTVGLLFLSPGILFMSVGVILLIRTVRGK